MHSDPDLSSGASHMRTYAAFVAALLAAFVLASQIDFLLFHVLAEFLSITVATAAFFVAWNTRRMTADGFLLVMGTALAAVAAVDLVHTLAYKGMDVLHVTGANPPTQLWIAGRWLLGVSMAVSPLFIGRRVHPLLPVAVFGAAAVLLVASVFARVFPDCYVEGQGLTAFKVGSEYAVCVLLAVAGVSIHRKRAALDPRFATFLHAAIVCLILSELCFTLYNDVYGVIIILAHLLKIAAFAFFYGGIIDLGLNRPLTFLFRDLKAREEELARSEALLVEAQAIARVGSFTRDVATGASQWTDQMYRLLGLEPGTVEPAFDRVLEAVHPEDKDYMVRAMADVEQGVRPYDLEYRVVFPDGQVRHLHLLGTVERGPDGRAVTLRGTAQDVTELKRHNAQLEDRRNIDATFTDLAAKMLATQDLERVCELTLDVARSLTKSPMGYAGYIDEATGHLISPTITRDVWDACQVAGKTCVFKEFTGLWGWVLTQRRPLMTNDPRRDPRASGVPMGHIPIQRFLSSPALAGTTLVGQIALANAEAPYTEREVMIVERLAALFAQGVDRARREGALRTLFRALEQSPVAVVITDKDGGVEYVNPTYETITGHAAHEVLGRELRFLNKDGDPEPRKEAWESILQGKPWSGEFKSKAKDGRVYWESVTMAPVHDERGQLTNCIVLKEDVTHRKELEELKDDVERIMRHDLRAPLTAIVGMPRLMLEDPSLSEKNKEFVRLIQEAGYRMLNLINQSLELHRMEIGAYAFTPERVDLAKVLRRLQRDLQSKAEDAGVNMVLTLDGREPGPDEELPVRGEEPLCYSLFANLLTNAFEASLRGGLVRVAMFRDTGGRVEITNPGRVPEAVRERFFEKYSTSGKKGGTGLGTYSARLMTEVQGGSITMRTSEAEGTTLVVTLPGVE